MDKTTSRLEFKSDGNGEEYEVQAICDSAVYARESEAPTRPLLFDLMERLSQRKKHLVAYLGSAIPLQTYQHLLP